MQISWLLDKGVKMGKRKKSSHSRKGVSVRKFDGRKKRFGRGRESENKNEICADQPHQVVSTPRPGDGLVGP